MKYLTEVYEVTYADEVDKKISKTINDGYAIFSTFEINGKLYITYIK